MRSNATTPSSKKRSTDADTSPSREIQVRNAMESTEPPEATPLWATSTESTPRPDISTRSAHDLHDWFQAVRASKEFGPPVGGSASSARRSSPTPPANEPAVASAPRSSGSAGSNTSFQSSTSSEHALPPPVRDPRRRSHDDLASSAHHQYHTSSLLAEAGSPGIAPPSSPILRHQVSLPRAAMEIASLLARVSQLEDQMLQVEETQAKSRRQLNRIEGHLDALVREGRKRHDMQRSRGRRPASRQENRRIPTPDTWLQGNSSASSIDEGSSPRTPPVAVADFASGYVLAGTTKAKLLRESLLHEGYGTSLLKVFAVVNDEHEARLTLQEDVAHIRSAIEGMKQHLPHDMVDRTSPDRHPPLQNPTNRGPSVTPYTNMGSHFSYDSSDDEVEESEGSTRASNPGTPLDQPNLGLGLTTRNSTEQGGNESFSTPPLRPSSRM